MANYCSYTMSITGRKTNVNRMVKILKYKDKEYELARIFDADVSDYGFLEHENKTITLQVSGSCAWSVYSCMMKGKGSYYHDSYPDSLLSNLEYLTDKLNLVIEVYSEEPGICFQEHILVKKGNVIIDDYRDWQQIYDVDGILVGECGGYENWDFQENQNYFNERGKLK